MQQLLMLFEQQQYADCIFAINQFNLEKNPSADTFLLSGKCNYQLGLQNKEAVFYQKSFDDFTKAILLNNHLLEARLYRAYLAIYCLDNKLETALEDSAFIIKNGNGESKTKGLQYQFEAAFALGNEGLATESLQHTKPLITAFYKDNQPQRLQELALLELRMGDVLFNLKKDGPHAISYYENGFNYYPYNTAFNHFILPVLISFKKYDFAATLAHTIIDMLVTAGGYEQLTIIREQFGDWLNAGVKHQGIAKMYLRSLRNSDDADTLDIIIEAKKLMAQYPNEPYFAASIGDVLFERKSYAEALPYIKKAFAMQYNPRVLCNLFQCNYYLYKTFIPLPKPPQNSDAVDAYSAGVDIDDFIKNFESGSEKWKQAVACQVYFYENAHAEFVRFFYQNSGTPISNHPHYFAMNCNNYGVALCNLGKYEMAIPIYKTGFALSPFWAQLNSLADAQYHAKQFADCVLTIQKMYNEYDDGISLYYHINYQQKLVSCYRQTNCNQDAFKVIAEVEQQETEIYEAVKTMHRPEADFILTTYNIILNAKSVLLQETGQVKNALESLQQRLEKDPDNAIVYYMLIHQYHIDGQYKNAVDCAENYFQLVDIKKADKETLQNIFYRKGASLRHLKRFGEAIESLQNAMALNAAHYWSRHELALAFFESGSAVQFKYYGHWCIDEYINNDFNWDNKISEIAFALIEVYKAEKKKKEIRKLTDFILKKNPQNAQAMLLKKEFSSWF